MNKTIIGIIGGMGPEATAKFYFDLIKHTKVSKDQDHYHVIIDSNSKIPDRTKGVFKQGPSPQDELIKSAKRLEKASVAVGCIPCITAHYYHSFIQEAVDFPILHAIKEVDNYLNKHYQDIAKIGVLCTTGTRQMGLFDKHIMNCQVIYPSDESQMNLVMEAIYGEGGIKQVGASLKAKKMLVSAANEMIEAGAELIVAGCTEIPIAIDANDFKVPYLDTMQTVIEKLLTLE